MKWNLKIAGLALLGLLAAASVAQGLRNAARGSGDFLWPPAKAFAQGVNPYQFERHDTVYYPLVYPPAGLIPLAPYTFLGRGAANLLWAASNLALTALALLCVRSLWLAETGPFLVFSALMLCSNTWRGGLGNGNYNIFALCCFVLACHQAQRGRKGAAGLFLGLSWIKYTLTFPLAWLFVKRRDWPTLLWAVLAQACLTALCGLRLGVSPFGLLAACARHTAYLSHGAYGAASDFSAVIRYCLGPGYDAPARALSLALMAFCLAVCAVRDKPDDGDKDLIALGILACASLTCVYHMDYDYLALLFPLIYLFRRGMRSAGDRFAFLAILYFWFVVRLQYCRFAGPGLVMGLNVAGLPLLLGLIAVFRKKSLRTANAQA